MKTQLLALSVLILFISCNTTPKKYSSESKKIIFQQKDKKILKQVFNLYSKEKNTPSPMLVAKVGTFFKGTPYVAHTLETDKEKLIINLREMDCTTFAENCLAITNTLKSGNNSFEQFAAELTKIRYRNGNLTNYPSRLHYFCDWIYNNTEMKLVKDMSEEIAHSPFKKTINFMSTHPESYQQLLNNSSFVKIMAIQEKEISARPMFFIPENKLESIEDKLMDGDIVGITTSVSGLAISHVGILIRKKGHIHLMHESSAAKKVVISKNTLKDYLLNSKSATGIMVARPL